MTTCREHLIQLVNAPDPLYYLVTHEEEIAWAIKEIDRWEELKIQVEHLREQAHTARHFSRDAGKKYDYAASTGREGTCANILLIMDKLEKI